MKATFIPEGDLLNLKEGNFSTGLDLEKFDTSHWGSKRPVKTLDLEEYQTIRRKICPQDIEVGSDGVDFEYRGRVSFANGKNYAVYTKANFALILVDPDYVEEPPRYHGGKKLCCGSLKITLK